MTLEQHLSERAGHLQKENNRLVGLLNYYRGHDFRAKIRNEALEEAAKVVESGDYDGDTFDLLAAAIRALK